MRFLSLFIAPLISLIKRLISRSIFYDSLYFGFKSREIMKIKIGNKLVGDSSSVFVIAEAGVNHNGNVKIAKKMITKAKESMADAIKFQTFKALDLTSPQSKYFKIFKNLELDENSFGELSDYARNEGIIFLSTPFSNEAVDILESLKVPAFKIASGDLTNIPLIRYTASKNKPIIISTGMANFSEIEKAVKTIRSVGNNTIMIMHSVSSYPTPHNETNLHAIKQIQNKFQYPVGYSDNGTDTLVSIMAVGLGAKLIEKHFTLDKKMKGPDNSFSTEPREFRKLISQIRMVEQMLGNGIKKCQPSERENRIHARRSVYARITIEKGKRIEDEMLSLLRPAAYIMPIHLDKIIGKKVTRTLKAYEPLKWSDIR